MAKFSFAAFAKDVLVGAQYALPVIAAIKENPDASDISKAATAITGASQAATAIDPNDTATISEATNVAAIILQALALPSPVKQSTGS